MTAPQDEHAKRVDALIMVGEIAGFGSRAFSDVALKLTDDELTDVHAKLVMEAQRYPEGERRDAYMRGAGTAMSITFDRAVLAGMFGDAQEPDAEST